MSRTYLYLLGDRGLECDDCKSEKQCIKNALHGMCRPIQTAYRSNLGGADDGKDFIALHHRGKGKQESPAAELGIPTKNGGELLATTTCP